MSEKERERQREDEFADQGIEGDTLNCASSQVNVLVFVPRCLLNVSKASKLEAISISPIFCPNSSRLYRETRDAALHPRHPLRINPSRANCTTVLK